MTTMLQVVYYRSKSMGGLEKEVYCGAPAWVKTKQTDFCRAYNCFVERVRDIRNTDALPVGKEINFQPEM